MADKTIMLVCAAGMSTSLLVSKMQKRRWHKDWTCWIFSQYPLQKQMHTWLRKIDVLMLGPQVKYMKKQFEDKVAGTDTKMDVINMQDYGMMNGEKVLKTALTLLGE